MKLSTVILAVTLTANVALLGVIAVGSSDEASSTGPAPATVIPAGRKIPVSEAATGSEMWLELQSADLAVQRDRLRAAGFPAELIRAILAAQIRETFAARVKAIENAQGEMPFWKNPVRDPKMQAALRDLYREQEKALKALLGRDARDDDPSYTAYLRRQFGDLPDDKVDLLRQISDDYNQRRSDIYGNSPGAMLPEDRKKLAELDKAMHADFAGILSPQELEEYDLRSSNTAQQLRYNLAAFDATEQEYRAIYKLQSEFDDKYAWRYGPGAPEEVKMRADAAKQLTADLKTALGDARYDDYQRATDYGYRQTSQLVARLELPPENATALWNTQKEFEKRRGEIYSPSTPPAERTQQIAALQQEANAKITTLLGGDPSRVEIYKQNGGQWLQSLAPRPALPPRL